MEDITDYFVRLLGEHHSVDMAEAEFKRVIADDAELHARYRAWCRLTGDSEKGGFINFCREYLDDRNEVWDSLYDYDE